MPYLKHYGILGMRWGVRQTPEELGHRTRRAEYPRSRKKISQMSDSELKSKIDRMQKESQYRQLSQRSLVKMGKRIAGMIVGAAAIEIAKEIVKGKMKAGVDFVKEMENAELMDTITAVIKG